MNTTKTATHGAAPRIAGHLALDWLNTLVLAPEGPVDFLDSDCRVKQWLAESAMEGAAACESLPPDALSARAIALREIVRHLVANRMEGRRADPSGLNAFLAAGAAHLGLVWKRGAAAPSMRRVFREQGADTLLSPIAEAAAELLSREDFSVVKTCQNPACSQLFCDYSATRRRRWCDMSICGNRMKAAAFRARSRAGH